MNYKDFLPIGSVVVLKEGEKKLMVFGILQTNAENAEEEYDYIGVPYPEGNLGDEYQYLFNHDNIAEVFFRGYEDEERATFVEKLVELQESGEI